MKNKMSDVRDHLVAMLEALGEDNTDPEAAARTIERAKASSLVASTYISAVKTELDALRVADEIGCLPSSVAPGERIDRASGQVLSFDRQKA